MPIFCRKKVHPLKNIMLPCHFLQICHEKTPAFMPVLGYKNFNSVKTTLWAKKVYRISFFRIFHEKINSLKPIFCKKCPFSKKTLLSCPYFVKKKSIISKTLCSNVIFSNFPWKIPCYYAHTWVKNVHSVKITLYYARKRSIGCPFFPIFHKK